MDMWEETKKKIQGLEKDPLVGGDLLKTMDTISIADYWRRRYEEEHALWESRFNGKLEESASLMEKLRKSEGDIKETQLRLELAQKERENERRTWEERMKVREMENQLLRERAEWEAKLRMVQQQAGMLPGERYGGAVTYNQIPQVHPQMVADIDNLRQQLSSSESERKRLSGELAKTKDILENSHSSIEEREKMRIENERLKKEKEDVASSLNRSTEALNRTISEMSQQLSSLEAENTRLRSMSESLPKQMREAGTRYEARETARFETQETFARGFAHRLRNYMGIVSGTLQLSMSEFKMAQELKDQLILADQHIQEMLKCMEEMISLSRKPEMNSEQIFLNAFMGVLIPAIKEKAGAQNVQVDWTPAANVPSCKADSKLIGEAVEHIITNSLEAMPNGGSLNISTFYDADKATAVLKFSDTGSGINDVHLKKVFQPYFTTKKNKKGMGLAIVQRIMDLHHSSVVVESVKGKSTVVSLNFPCV